jgi:oligosaccharide repeat unit polymerase
MEAGVGIGKEKPIVDSQLMLIALLFGFAGLLVTHAIVVRSWCTGQTALTGMWLLSAITLTGLSQSWPYLNWEGVGLMLGMHASFFAGSLFVEKAGRHPKGVLVLPRRADRIAISRIYWVTLGISIAGIGLLLQATGAWQLVSGLDVSVIRYVTLGVTDIPPLPRVLSNFMLIPAVMAPAMSIVKGQSRPHIGYYVLPVFCLLGQSVAFGGRGAVTFGGLLIFWGFVVFIAVRFFGKLDRRTVAILSVVVVLLLGYSEGIFSSRRDVADDNSGFAVYLGLPIVAGCEALKTQPDLPTLALGFDNLAPVRETINVISRTPDKRVDDLVVMIPEPYNVFTSLLEHLQAFGFLGMLLVAVCLGAFCRWLERSPQTVGVAMLRTLMYCYLSMSLFADLAFFYSGWFLAVVAVAVVLPLMVRPYRRRVATPTGYPSVQA